MSRRRLLLAHRSLEPGGGSNAVAAWMLQALVRDFDVTLVTTRAVDVAATNRFCGTTLDARTFRAVVAPAYETAIVHLAPFRFALLELALLARAARPLASAHDLVVSSDNELDFGRRAIQYVHYPTYQRPRPASEQLWFHRAAPFLLDGYYRLCDLVADYDGERMRQNLTLANSRWTAARVRALHGIDALTIYPPIADAGPAAPFAERAPSFLTVGRIDPDKELEKVMHIVARVRRRHPDCGLTFVGVASDPSYLRRLRETAATLGDWVRFRIGISREELRREIGAHRFGLHGMRDEHFGMGVAEMVRGGCVVWVPDGGGQVEIVGDEPCLRYRSEEDAADKILDALATAGEVDRLRRHLESCGERFSSERFAAEIRQVVADFR